MGSVYWVRIALKMIAFGMVLSFVHSKYASSDEGKTPQKYLQQCELGLPLSIEEKEKLLSQLKMSKLGKELVQEFEQVFGTLDRLVIQWDHVSYSQITKPPKKGRSLASVPSRVACVHLAKKLPDIEHIADLAHELVHANRLSEKVLEGIYDVREEFVRARITARGGEVEAFKTECQLKKEILNRWDHICSPYVTPDQEFSENRVIEDFYEGRLSASLTGEAYPVMLGKQFERLQQKRSLNAVLKD